MFRFWDEWTDKVLSVLATEIGVAFELSSLIPTKFMDKGTSGPLGEWRTYDGTLAIVENRPEYLSEEYWACQGHPIVLLKEGTLLLYTSSNHLVELDQSHQRVTLWHSSDERSRCLLPRCRRALKEAGIKTMPNKRQPRQG